MCGCSKANAGHVQDSALFDGMQDAKLQKPCCAACAQKMPGTDANRLVSASAQPIPEIVYRVLHSPGVSLDGTTRTAMEGFFRQDLDDVRIHVDSQAADSAEAISALAYTFGNHIVFGAGRYCPGTKGGDRILVHELTHVVQQMSRNSARMSVPELITDSSDAGEEIEAEWFAVQWMQRKRGGTPQFNHHSIFAEKPQIARLGSNPGCTQGQRERLHQGIFDANGWVQNALRKLEQSPMPAIVRSSLRRNFGNTYGVAANIPMLASRIRYTRNVMNKMTVGCNPADAGCTAGTYCGYTPTAGVHSVIICNWTISHGDARWLPRCILHEAFHAAFSRVHDAGNYSTGHGTSSPSAIYPGTGLDPLLTADTYTTLVMDLS
jgi:hypothetical protein